MNLCSITYFKFTKNNNIKIDGKINLYSNYIVCNFKTDLLKC